MKYSDIYKTIHHFTARKVPMQQKIKFWHWLTFAYSEKEKEEVLHDIWNNIEVDADAGTHQSLDEVMRKIQRTSAKTLESSFRMRHLLRVAAVLLIPLLSILFSNIYIQEHLENAQMIECNIPRGEQREILLPDGTKVKINSGSFLLYPQKFYGDTRTVYLSGEANFEVHKDAKHPFIVKTAQMAVKALGTKFNVQAYPDFGKTIATLENGSVLVTDMQDSNQVFKLTPNEQLEYDHYTSKFEKRTVNAQIAAGWTVGEMNFINSPLKEIIISLQNHYNSQITIDPRLQVSDLYTIKFKKNEPFKNAIHILTLTIDNIEANFTNNKTVTLSCASEKKGGAHK